MAVEFTGKTRCLDPDADKGVYRKVWAGKITSKPLTIKVKPLVEPADIAALKVLCRTEKKFKDGAYGDIWYPSSRLKYGESPFRTVLAKYPGSLFAKHAELAEARVWAGGHAPGHSAVYKKASHHLTRLIEGYPASRISDDADLLMARIYLHADENRPGKGGREKAIEYLRHLVATYPKSDSVPVAKKLLAEAMKAKETNGKETENEARRGKREE